ncbi:MAG: putative motility protein [Nitrospirota bacterium]
MMSGVGLSSGNIAEGANVSVIKKSLDMMEINGAAVVDLINKAGAQGQQMAANPEGTGSIVNMYV